MTEKYWEAELKNVTEGLSRGTNPVLECGDKALKRCWCFLINLYSESNLNEYPDRFLCLECDQMI